MVKLVEKILNFFYVLLIIGLGAPFKRVKLIFNFFFPAERKCKKKKRSSKKIKSVHFLIFMLQNYPFWTPDFQISITFLLNILCYLKRYVRHQNKNIIFFSGLSISHQNFMFLHA